jgi:hypothetical protein
MERTMDRISVESISGESMSIFAKSMDARMPKGEEQQEKSQPDGTILKQSDVYSVSCLLLRVFCIDIYMQR